jgi:V/A-type H+/Na+-transporting ATPase subunit I
MAIAQMKKFMIASHRSEAADLLEALQRAGIVQILDAERAMISKEWPELEVKSSRPKYLEDMVSRLEKSISFLEAHAVEDSPKSLFKPLIPVNEASYTDIVNGTEVIDLLEQAEAASNKIEDAP